MKGKGADETLLLVFSIQWKLFWTLVKEYRNWNHGNSKSLQTFLSFLFALTWPKCKNFSNKKTWEIIFWCSKDHPNAKRIAITASRKPKASSKTKWKRMKGETVCGLKQQESLCVHSTVLKFRGSLNYDNFGRPTPWLTLLLVLGKSRVKQNSC